MIIKLLKNKIFKIIPESSILIKSIKRIYSFFIYLNKFLGNIFLFFLKKFWKIKLVNNLKEKNIDFLKVSTNIGELAYFESIKKKLIFDSPVILYDSSEKRSTKYYFHPVEVMWLLDDLGYLFFTFDRTGKIVLRSPRQYDTFIIALKPKHKLKLGL